MKVTLTAPCHFGLESVLSSEVRRMDAENVQVTDGRVTFDGDEQMIARANIGLRTAERVQLVLGQFEARSFEELFARARARCLSLEVELLGTRPAGKNVPAAAQAALAEVCVQAVQQAFGTRPQLASASTDCNIPLSMGIPSVCFGCLEGGGAHTREEWIKPASLGPGLVAAGLALCGLL